jgi:hypothetical protein
MNLSLQLKMTEQVNPVRQTFTAGTARTSTTGRTRKIFCGLLAITWPFAAAFAQSSSSSQQSSSSAAQSSTPTPAQSPAQPATADQPQKSDSLAEAARKAKEKKPAAAKGKVYTEDDLSKMKGPGVSVVGDAPRKNSRRAQPTDPDGDGGENNEQYWRGRARQFLDAIAQTEQQIEQKKEEIKKFGSGGFDVTTGRKDNIAYINDRNGQLKDLESRKADLQRQLDELQDEGRQAGAPASWFR